MGQWLRPDSLRGLRPISLAGTCALQVFDDGFGEALYAGGARNPSGGGPDLGHLAVWDGVSWTVPGGGSAAVGFQDDVRDLAVWDDGSGAALYIGGSFFSIGAPSVPAGHIAKWDGADWASPAGGANAPVESLMTWDDGAGSLLYASGDFRLIGASVSNGLGRWNGEQWTAFDSRGFGGSFIGQGEFWSVTAVHGSNTPGIAGLFAGGIFYLAGGVASSGFAYWQCETLPPEIFGDGFESGDVGAWAASAGVN